MVRQGLIAKQEIGFQIESINLIQSDLRHGLEFDCNLEALLDWGARLLINLNTLRNFYNLLKNKQQISKLDTVTHWIVKLEAGEENRIVHESS